MKVQTEDGQIVEDHSFDNYYPPSERFPATKHYRRKFRNQVLRRKITPKDKTITIDQFEKIKSSKI